MHVMAVSLKKRLVSAGSWVLGGKLLVATSNLLVGSLLARVLSTEEFGQYGVAFTVVYTGIVTFVILKVLDVVMGLRVNEEEETVGLDLAQHNERGYNL